MALPKICGIETEYGIIVRGVAEIDPIAASSTLVNAYVSAVTAAGGQVGHPHRVGWDFEGENPANDARGGFSVRSFAPEVETHLVNAVLPNGSRFYVDHAHPEFSSPECRTAHDAVRYDVAGEEILRRAMAAALVHEGGEIVVYKNNSDGKGQSYGCHENYLLARSCPFDTIARAATTHFVTRGVLCGAGKVGSELPGSRGASAEYQLTQRADFFEERVGLETTLKRPIINTRDEPHADPHLYRRLHVIVGDANMSQVATLLKLGTTAIWLAAIEDGASGAPIEFRDPVAALQAVSRDVTLNEPLELLDGSTMTALNVQMELFERCSNYAETHGLECVGEDSGRDVLRRWGHCLEALDADPSTTGSTVDWVAKQRLLDGYQARHALADGDDRLRAIDLQYHDIRPERGLSYRVGLETIITTDEATGAVSDPPDDTRAWFRGQCLQRYPGAVVAANWDSLVFDVGQAALQRVPMMEPLKGTKEQLETLLDRSPTASELLKNLAG